VEKDDIEELKSLDSKQIVPNSELEKELQKAEIDKEKTMETERSLSKKDVKVIGYSFYNNVGSSIPLNISNGDDVVN